MKTYLQMDGDQLVEYVEKREYDKLALALQDAVTRMAGELERELNAAKAEIEGMKKAIKTASDSLDGLDKHLHGNLGMFLLLALEKLQPFLK